MTKQVILEVRHQLYPAVHEVMHRHECRLLHSAKPANQLVSNDREPCQCFEIIPDALKKVPIHIVVLIGTSCQYNAAPLGECDFLRALLQEREQGWPIFLFVCRKAIDHLVLEIWEGHCQKEL